MPDIMPPNVPVYWVAVVAIIGIVLLFAREVFRIVVVEAIKPLTTTQSLLVASIDKLNANIMALFIKVGDN